MRKAEDAGPNWLGLEEAARRLDVHPATLRDWADRGRIRAFRTPGGHRRFSEEDLTALQLQSTPDLSLLMHATVGQARLALNGGRLAGEGWYALFDESTKAGQRRLGIDLMELLVAYLGDRDADWGPKITQLGESYAALSRQAGISLGDSLRAFHLFEGLVRSSVGELAAARVPAPADLDQGAAWFLNEVRVAMVESLSREG